MALSGKSIVQLNGYGETMVAGIEENMMSEQETAILAGGCFWCLEAVYLDIRGVISVEPGYIAGQVPHPTYEAVCTGRTGHAEAVRIVFDPQQVGFRDLLEVFFVIHDPTQLDRQGNDVGTQYRSGIYWTGPEQKRVASDMINELAGQAAYDAPIVTELRAASTFYPAETYHHRYYERHPMQAYCAAIVAPKLAKFRDKFRRLRNG